MGAIADRVVRGRFSVVRRVAPALALAGLIVGSTAVLSPPAGAAGAVGSVSVTVNRDYYGDGTYHAPSAGQTGDPAQPGMVVTATDVNGKAVQKTTDAAGAVTISVADGLTPPYRIDVSIPAPYSSYLGFAPVKSGGDFANATDFVDPSNGTNVSLRVPVWDPADYVPAGTKLAVPVESNFGPGGLSTDDTSLVTTPNSPQGAVTPVAKYQDTGTTFGVAWDKTKQLIYTSAFAKAYAPYASGGPGAIYTVDPASGQSSLFADVTNAGTSQHNPTNLKLDNVGPAGTPQESGFYSVPGTESLGGLAISDDGKTLYTVNMNTKQLVGINVSTKAQTVTAIPDPDCTLGQWRPMAVSAHDGDIFVGGVCDASAAGATRADLKAVVWRFHAGAFAATPYYTHALDFTRAAVQPLADSDIGTHWNTWTQTYSPDEYSGGTGIDFEPVRPEPELASISFDSDESMALGFRDRTGDQLGVLGPVGYTIPGNPPTFGSDLVSVMTGGDVNRVCKTATGFVWDGDPGCRNANNDATYYPQDTTIQDENEAAQGSTVLVPQLGQLTSTFMDPAASSNSDGLGFFASDGTSGPTGGDPSKTTKITQTTLTIDAAGNTQLSGNGLGKANGLGAIALLATAAPVQIGNRVWLDANRNGVQDAGELSLQHAKVTLMSGGKPVLDQNGQPVVAFTDSNGEYYFGGPASTYQLTPGAQYTVEFDVSTVNNLPSGVTVPSLRYTTSKAGGDSRHDSNTPAVSTPTADATVTAPSAPGGVDHTIDAGVYSLNIPVPPTTTTGSGGRLPHAPHSPDSGPLSGGTGSTVGTSSPNIDINTGGPAEPSGPNPWLITGGIAALAAAGLTTGMAMRRSRIPRS